MVELVSAGLGVEDGDAPGARSTRRSRRRSRSSVSARPTEQAHVVLGVRALARDDPDRYALVGA